MRFVDYLKESDDYKTVIEDEDKIIELYKKNCINYDFENPIYRGTNGRPYRFALIDGSKGGRVSANTSNHYTIIFDHLLKERNLPLRSKSVICSTDEEYAKGFGETYIVIPYDNSKIGICPNRDIWNIRIAGVEGNISLSDANDVLARAKIKETNFEDIIQQIKEKVSLVESGETEVKKGSSIKALCDLVGYSSKHVRNNILNLYGLDDHGFKFATGKTLKGTKHLGNELWISGECLFIKEYDKILTTLKNIKH